jgi:hypothetical protein
MHLSRPNLILALLPFIALSIRAQDSIPNKENTKFGVTYHVNAGPFYNHGIGAFATVNDKHQIELNALIIPGVNPFKDKTHLGSSLNYNFLPNKADNFLNLTFNSSIYFTNYLWVDEYIAWPNVKKHYWETQSNEFTFQLGMGFDTKLTKRVHLAFSASSLVIGYGFYKSKYIDYVNNTEFNSSGWRFTYIRLNDFLINNLLAKIGIKYIFKNK